MSDNLTTTKNVLSEDALFAMINANEVAAIHTERDCVNGVHSIKSIGQLFACMVNRQFETEINTTTNVCSCAPVTADCNRRGSGPWGAPVRVELNGICINKD
jgi:hypothetical protein